MARRWRRCYHFFLTYPTPRGTSRLRAWLLAPPFAGVLLGLAALGWPALYTPAYLARMATLLGYLLLGIGLLIRSFTTVGDRAERRGLAIIDAGSVAAVLPFAALYLLPTVLGRAPLAAAEQVILALALLPAGFAYAILRHNALDVHLLQRWLVHGLLRRKKQRWTRSTSAWSAPTRRSAHTWWPTSTTSRCKQPSCPCPQ